MRTASSTGCLPDGVGVYYTPPGVHASQASRSSMGRWPRSSRAGSPRSARQRARGRRTGVIVLLLARLLWPARPVTWVASVGFFAFLPTVAKDGCDVPSRAARDAGHRRGAARARRMVRAQDVLVVDSHSCSAPARRWGSWCAPGRSGWLVVAVVVLAVLRSERSCSRRAALARRSRSSCSPQRWCRALVRASGDPVLEPGLRPSAGGRVHARPTAALLLRRRRLPRRRRATVAGPFQRPVSPGSLCRDVGRLLRNLVVGHRSRGPDRRDRLVARSAELRSACFRPLLALAGVVALLGLADHATA